MSIEEAYRHLCAVTTQRCNVEDGALDLNSPPTSEQLTEAQGELSIAFPPDLLELYRLGNGQRSVYESKAGPVAHDVLAGAQLLSLEFMLECSKVMADRAVCTDESPDHGNKFIRPTFWSSDWVPVGSSSGFGSVAIMDLAPGETGVFGQIFFITEPYIVSGIVARGIEDFMLRCAEHVPQSGVFQWSDLPTVDPLSLSTSK